MRKRASRAASARSCHATPGISLLCHPRPLFWLSTGRGRPYLSSWILAVSEAKDIRPEDKDRQPGTILFVYGTLKRGQRSHQLLAGQRFLGSARTLPRYRLYDCGRYPALVADPEHGRAIQGELWLVDDETLRRLDILEGTPILYTLLPVELEGQTGPAWTYIYQQDVRGLRDCGSEWP